MSEKEYRDRLAEADSELNRRGSEGRLRKRTDLTPLETAVNVDWHGSGSSGEDKTNAVTAAMDTTGQPLMRKRRIGFLLPFFLFCLLFFLVAAGIAYLRFSGNGNTVSNDNIAISVSGPLAVRAGEPLALEVLIENKNSVPLEYVDLIATFPDGTRMTGDGAVALPRLRESLGTIPANGFRKDTVKAVLYGQEDAESKIAFTIEYRVPGSNAIFHKDKETSIVLSDAPLRLAVVVPETSVSGDKVKVTATVTSNAATVLHDVYLAAGYPPGFSYTSASQNPAVGSKLWSLGDIAPGTTRTLAIDGVVEGEQDESKIFRFTVGVGQANGGVNLAYAAQSSRLQVTHPQLGVEIAMDGNTATPATIEGGKQVRVDLSWINNMPEKLLDATLSLSLTGALLDKHSVVVEKGFYDSGSDTITITKADLPSLASIAPGEKGSVSIAFTLLSPEALGAALAKNPTINLALSATARRIADAPQTPSVTSTIAKEVHVPSALTLITQALYTSGPFANSGPLPPKVGVQTTYTIVWTLSNAGNDLRDVSVQAVLPPYVKYVGTVSPAAENIVYTDSGRTVRWSVDRLSAGTGYASSAKTVAFQVELTPSVTQVDQAPIILGETTASGRDLFVGADVRSVRRELSTELTSDPAYTTGKGAVKE